MNLLLCQALFLFVTPPSVKPSLQPVWDYHRKELHRDLESSDFYGAKRSLVLLQKLDPQVYQEKRFGLTAAWIAGREQNWATAYKLNHASGIRDAMSTLEAAQSLENMGRYEEALAEVFDKKVKHRGRALWDANALAARCHLALGQHQQSIVFFRKMLSRRAPTVYRTNAYNTLVELYYKQGSVKRARKLAHTVQEGFPASDAALFTMYLQEAFEDTRYLNHPDNLNRFANVCYRNRDFERSNQYFTRLLELESKGKRAARTRFYLALTYTKQGDSAGAQHAFQQAAPYLEGTSYEGNAVFQVARTFYLNGEDAETVAYISNYWNTSHDVKWRTESTRMWILALRRQQDLAGFEQLRATLSKEKACPAWLWAYYHKNGMLWALQEERYVDARNHLNSYVKTSRLKAEGKHEVLLWQGLIHWAFNEQDEAIEAWLQVATKDPNHYFGLVARRLLANGVPHTLAWEKAVAKADLNNISDLRRLYFLAPSEAERKLAGSHLQDAFQKGHPDYAFDETPQDESAMVMAEIGRFDRAARTLTRDKRKFLAYHYHKSLWFQLAEDKKSSIHHAEILVNSYPRWMPYEMMNQGVQELFFPLGYSALVFEQAAERGVDPFLLLAIIREESRFDNNAKSWASARGLMQFIPATAREMAAMTEGIGTFSLPRLYQPEVAVALGATYVSHLSEAFSGANIQMVAAYNAGESATARWRDLSGGQDLAFVWDVSYSETKRYCQKVMRAYYHYSRLYGSSSGVIGKPDLQELARLKRHQGQDQDS